jgi:AbiV family abortive infection protein
MADNSGHWHGAIEATFAEDSIESKAIGESRFNSLSLYESAKQLFEAERWGTSISLSILACEEAGKFMMFAHSLGASFHDLAGLRGHKEKQERFARYLESCLRIRALDEYLLECGENDDAERILAALALHEKALLLRQNATDDFDPVLRDPEIGPIWAEMYRRMSADNVYKVAEQATSGKLDQVKQRGLYVDVTKSQVLSPRIFTRDDAQLYLRAAEIVVSFIVPKKWRRDEPVFLKYVTVRIGLTQPVSPS